MKNVFLTITLISLVSCADRLPQDPIISGQIVQFDAGVLTLTNADRTFRQSIAVTDKGSFIDTLSIDEGFYQLTDGANTTNLYLVKGSNLSITYDAQRYQQSLSFAGKGERINHYLKRKKEEMQRLLGAGTAVYTLEETTYKHTFDSINKTLGTLLNGAEGISADFREKERNNLYYNYLSYLNRYERYHAYYAKKEDFKVSDHFLEELASLSLDNEADFLFSQSYRGLVEAHYQQQATLSVQDDIPSDVVYLKTVNQVPVQSIKNHLLFRAARYGITYTEHLEDYYSLFMEGSTNPQHRADITQDYDRLRSLSEGQPSPTFTAYENYLGGTTSLADLKGSYVYIDVWATWCGPCKYEIPFLKTLEKKYHDKNITFVSISIDKAKDHAAWKEMVSAESLKGVQLFADNDWNSQFVKNYLIKGIPRFILLDSEGQIISANAKRPSDPALAELLDTLPI